MATTHGGAVSEAKKSFEEIVRHDRGKSVGSHTPLFSVAEFLRATYAFTVTDPMNDCELAVNDVIEDW